MIGLLFGIGIMVCGRQSHFIMCLLPYQQIAGGDVNEVHIFCQ